MIRHGGLRGGTVASSATAQERGKATPGSEPPTSAVGGRALIAYALAKLVPGLITFASVPVWLGHFGAPQYGQFAFVWALSAITGSLAVGWIRQSVLRGAGNQTWSIDAVSLPIHLALSIASALPVTLIAYTGVSGDHGPFAFASAATGFSIVSSIYTIAQSHAQRSGRSTLYAAADSVRTAVALGASLGPSFLVGHGSVAILNGGTISYVVATVILYRWCVPSKFKVNSWLHSRREAMDMWTFGWPMSLWLAVTGALTYMDRFFIRLTLTPTEVGQYSAIADLAARGVPMITFPITMAIHPIAMQLWNRQLFDEAVAIVKHGILIICYSVVGMTALTWVFAPYLIRVILPTVPPGRTTITILVIGSAAWQIALLVHKPFEFTGRTRTLLVFAMISTAATGIIDWISIPELKGTGAAIGLATGACLYCVLAGAGSALFLRDKLIGSSRGQVTQSPEVIAVGSQSPLSQGS